MIEVILLVLVALLIYVKNRRITVNEEFILAYEFPQTVRENVAKAYCSLSAGRII